MPNESLFTKIINREIEANIRFEDDKFIAFDDINPMAPEHVLIVPKEPYMSLEAVDFENNEFYAELLKTARKIAKQLGIDDNYKLFMNVGKKVQAIQHLHLHLTGGWDKDKSNLDLDKESEKLINS